MAIDRRLSLIDTLIWCVLILGMAGLLAELSLLSHYEDLRQTIPIVLLAAGLAALILDRVSPRRWTPRVIHIIMILFIFAGLVGMYLHFDGSRQFQLEMDPGMSGATLIWHVLQAKSPPTLSPGTLVQMGILGMGYAYLRRSTWLQN